MKTAKPLDLPPAVAKSFVSAMRDFFAEANLTKRDAIAAHQLMLVAPNMFCN